MVCGKSRTGEPLTFVWLCLLLPSLMMPAAPPSHHLPSVQWFARSISFEGVDLVTPTGVGLAKEVPELLRGLVFLFLWGLTQFSPFW